MKVHDFIDRELGKAIPYGVYDLTANTGCVSVGVDHDTAEFAVETVRRWWLQMGRQAYPSARRLLLTADGGGSNSSRSRLWKFELQKLADALGLRIPPGTSKWNKIEHRMFCHITENWRGRPLVSHEGGGEPRSAVRLRRAVWPSGRSWTRPTTQPVGRSRTNRWTGWPSNATRFMVSGTTACSPDPTRTVNLF